MGLVWRDHPAWSVVDRAEAALGEPLAHLITDAPAEVLARTRNAQLAVLLSSLIAWEAMQPLAEAPVAFAGHSLGQVTALIAAGSLPFDEGVRFAARRAELTQAAADAHPGRMAALLGATVEQAEGACEAAADACWVANDNAPGQVVIAGTPEGLEVGSARAKELGVKRATPLNVGGAFHTPLMHDASVGLAAELSNVTFAAPAAPVVSNHDAVAYTDGDGWRDRLAEHVSVPVRWRSTMATLVDAGADTFLEVGHGSMLAALAKRGAPTVVVQKISGPDDITAYRANPAGIPTKLEVG
jgi:[acyl-carrier-protein] S-malonyltransferase